jgi:serine/threonine protein kinase
MFVVHNVIHQLGPVELCGMNHRQIAHYQVTAKLGQGGMGEVYRATDTKLDREVAIKVLPESFTQNQDRLDRFEREAKLLASLNHPNIAGIHGLEQAGDSQALILELVEGEDLSGRLRRGPLPLDEALDVCRQIAEALEAAHQRGIIHRDLKPADVKLTEEGKVKVLDFGLAKAATTHDGSGAKVADTKSPTIKEDDTLPGMLLGTAAYMSPEQARGRPVDRRSDIWSLGCVLYECLTGAPAFSGSTTSEIVASVIYKEPDWQRVPQEAPPLVLTLLRKLLTKDPRHRLHDVADARVDLELAITDPNACASGPSDAAIQRTNGSGHGLYPRTTVLVLAVALL